MFKKGRAPIRPRGLNNHAAKLSDQDVIEILNLCSSGLFTQAAVARSFNVTTTHVGYIRSGKARTNLTSLDASATMVVQQEK
jgi:hypothetical protein